MRVIAAAVFCLILTKTAIVYGAEDSRSSDLAFNGEDKSCYAVNRAYENMHNSGRYSYTISELQEDGHLKLAEEGRVIDNVIYSRMENGVWDEDRRPIRTPLDADSGVAVFTSCKELGDSQTEEGLAFHYSAHWHRSKWSAAIEIWISKTSGKFIKTIMHYDQGARELLLPVAVQIMDYDRAHAVKPTVPPRCWTLDLETPPAICIDLTSPSPITAH
ncbi:hypothetical protein B5E41_22675 [Rhizobium esperanzae]|uniref:Uncharacterized protein n=1 Tax=Rhizobium esperanzae TaxID=1967781 RepID=A0A246DQR6_9HYPH|nr:hypothetical protein [Rhizobium esperanzae]OWO92558.1 hypothetical protein B5E41_22675 [Rhizobium esperanzae]